MKTILALCALLCLPWSARAAEDYTVLFKTQGAYPDVRAALESAIEGQGLKINHSNKIAAMLERTGKDLGATTQVYEQAEQLEFCSATLSRQMMEADPHAIVMCPYIVVVYTLPKDPHVYLAYRKPPATRNPELQKALTGVEKLLTDIIHDAM